MTFQKDWEEVIQKPNEKFWIQEKRADGPTIFGSLCSPLSDVHETAPTDEQQKFIIKNWNKYSLLVQCLVTDTVTQFIAPNKTIKLTEYNKPLLSMDVSPSGELGVCSSVNGEIWIWETDTGTNRRVLEGHVGDVDSCRFFPSGLVVLSGASDYRVKIWSIKDGSCARTLTGHTRGIVYY
ncbi:PREDICTED: proteasomal ATPase-associated factor 1-like [Amphimedon queenslandica]|uniref:Proteasomal ATPase-associated factor 1 n=1 Tax=Amphimedon queenslandica TaxID=400682 RepID=A0AAN0JRW4_AMPQE|nr:PREDICTED: proteasomal ATPase-associated factor 1-like [Amphimedon queenslandica]|eukprot:XP_019859742.1 PREDICTED: proteasomal ATPase-associated factor 1-like [Amphimedon queenslandica]